MVPLVWRPVKLNSQDLIAIFKTIQFIDQMCSDMLFEEGNICEGSHFVVDDFLVQLEALDLAILRDESNEVMLRDVKWQVLDDHIAIQLDMSVEHTV